MWVSFSPDQNKPFIADIDGTKHNFVIDEKTGLALPRNMKKSVAHTQNAVNATIEAKPESKEKAPNIVKLDTENYGAPPEGSTIKLNPSDHSDSIPQAWCDDYGNWFYNFPGAIQLAKELGRKLPNIDQLIDAINANPDNFCQNAGFCTVSDPRGIPNTEFWDHTICSYFWSKSLVSGNDSRAYVAILNNGNSLATKAHFYRSNAFSVRFIA